MLCSALEAHRTFEHCTTSLPWHTLPHPSFNCDSECSHLSGKRLFTPPAYTLLRTNSVLRPHTKQMQGGERLPPYPLVLNAKQTECSWCPVAYRNREILRPLCCFCWFLIRQYVGPPLRRHSARDRLSTENNHRRRNLLISRVQGCNEHESYSQIGLLLTMCCRSAHKLPAREIPCPYRKVSVEELDVANKPELACTKLFLSIVRPQIHRECWYKLFQKHSKHNIPQKRIQSLRCRRECALLPD